MKTKKTVLHQGAVEKGACVVCGRVSFTPNGSDMDTISSKKILSCVGVGGSPPTSPFSINTTKKNELAE